MATGDILVIENENYIPEAIKLLDEAAAEILFSTYKLQIVHTPRGKRMLALLNALTKAIRRGVKCKVIVHYNSRKKGAPSCNFSAMAMLAAQGAEVRYLPTNRIIHAKILIMDSKKMITGSHNWSMSSLTKNYEVSLLVSDPSSVTQVKKSFLNVWSQGKPIDGVLNKLK